jgi:hypothetical protein
MTLLMASCTSSINHKTMYIINHSTDFADYNSILFLCESANVEKISRSELSKYLLSKELVEANTVIGHDDDDNPLYSYDYKLYDTLSINNNFSAEVILQIKNSEHRFYDFLVRTYTIKPRKLIDSQVFASWTKLLSGEFNRENQTFKVFDNNGYWEYKISEKGKIIEIE